MPALWLQLRAELSARWRDWLGLALVAGLAGGMVAAAAICARRTDSALSRYRVFSRAPDVYVGTGLTFRLERLDLARIRSLPQVEAVTRGVLPNADVLSATHTSLGPRVQLEVLPDRDGLEVVDRPKLLEGRLPERGRPDEAVADARAMRSAHLALGDTLSVRLRLGRAAVPGPPVALHIVGVRPDTFPTEAGSFVTATPEAFYRAHGGSRIAVAAVRNALKIRLRRGAADIPAFERDVERIAHGHDFQFTPFDVGAAKLQSGFHLQVQAWWIAAILGVAGLALVMGQGVARTLERQSSHDATLLALGMSPSQLGYLAIARSLLIGTAAVTIAVPVAVGLSPLSPVGRARDLEPYPGFAIDVPVLAGGALLVLATALLPGLVAAGRARRTHAVPGMPTAAPARAGPGPALARAGLPPALVTGVRMALPGGGSASRRSARATLVGAVLAVGVASIALTFTASLSHLLNTPRLSGLTWDYANFQGFGTSRDLARIRADPAIGAAAFGEDARLVIGGRQVGVAAYDDVKGNVRPTVTAGHAPTGHGEILLGTRIFATLGAHLGESIVVRRGDRAVRMRVVGRGVLPDGLFINLGEGSAMTFGSLHAVLPGAFRSRFLIRVAPGADREAVLDRLERAYGVPRASLPSEVSDFGGVRRLPLIIAGLVTLVAAAALTRNGLTSVRRRRRELAILTVLGFTRGQVRQAVAWQATTVAVIAAIVGTPVGVAAGRWAWGLFAAHTGFASEPVTPLGPTLLVVPVVVLLANLLAAVPGRLASRAHPAVVLRAE